MRQQRRLLLLASATALAIAGAAYVTLRGPGAPPESGIGQRLYPELGLRLDEVARVAIQRADSSFTLTRNEGEWRNPEKFDHPVAFERVRKLLLEIADLRTIETRTASPAQYAALEIEPVSAPDAKSTQVTLKDAGGAEIASLIVGKQRFGRGGPAGDGTYVRKAAEAQSWLVRGRLGVEREAVRWLERKPLEVGRERVREAVTVQADAKRLVVRRAQPGEPDFAIVDPPAERKTKPAYELNGLGGVLDGLEFDDVRPAAGVPFPASGAPPGAHAEISTFDGLIVRAELAQHEGATWVRFTARAATPAPAEEIAKEALEINRRVAPWVYRLPDWRTDLLRRKLDDLLEG